MRFFLLMLCLVGILVGQRESQAQTPQQRRELRQIDQAVTKAQLLYKRQKYEEAAEEVNKVQAQIQQMAAGANTRVSRQLQRYFKRLKTLHGQLELQGVELQPLVDLAAAGETPSGEMTSFTSTIAPMLVAKCGRCHVDRASGGFSMSSFPVLMRGPTAGVVIMPGKPDDSRLVEVIVEGDMPRGGGSVSDEELASLKKWIEEGAKFDGEDRAANLNSFATRPQTPRTRLEVTMATGRETVSFANDIAPVLVDNCRGCHFDTQRVQGGLNLTRFRSLLRGGTSGAMIVPGKPEESLLVQKLRGTADGQRMPVNRPPLDDATMAKIETWIKEGATFDASDANTNIETVASLARAMRSTPEQLSKERANRANRNWRLSMSGIDAQSAQSDRFLFLGNVDESTLATYAEQAEALVPQIAKMFKANASRPLLKGKMTFFVFRQRYDYSEFGTMVERRTLPRSWRGHWQYNILDAYAAIIPPRDDAYSLEGLMGQQIAGTYVASLGRGTPQWFAEGAARVAVARLDRKDTRVAAWNDQLAGILSKMQRADDFLTGKLPPESAHIASYHFVEFLMKDASRFSRLMHGLRKGGEFAETFATVYGGTPTQAAQVWVRSGGEPRRR